MAGTPFTIKGRIVQGDPYYVGQKKDDKTGLPRVMKNGDPLGDAFIALAIPKNDPAWPAFRAAHDADVARSWQPAQYGHRDFAHKIEDGDSIEPNKRGRRNVDREGFPGHWILKLANVRAINVVYWDTARGWVTSTGQNDVPMGDGTQRNVRCGDYVTVIGDRDSNESTQSPGMYQNVRTVAFESPGEHIVNAEDLTALLGTRGPGGAPAPTPAPAAAPSPATPAAPAAVSGTVSPGSITPPPPGYDGFMAPPPPPPAAPVRQMTAAAKGASFEQMIAAGWTEATMRQHGMLIDDITA